MKEIIEKLTTEFKSMKAVGCRIRDNYPDFHKQILELGVGSLPTGLFMFYNDIKKIPHCKECGEKPVKLISYNVGFREFCCVSHQKKFTNKLKLDKYNKEHGTSLTKLPANPKDVAKRQKTMMERYGTIMPMNDNPESVKKKEKTSMEKYGVRNAAHAPLVRKKAAKTMKSKSKAEKEKSIKKMKETMMKKHGVENPMQSQEFQDKAKETRMEKYSVEYILQNPDISAKQVETRTKTMLEKYNTTNIYEIDGVKEKMVQTNIDNYGVSHPMKNKEYQQSIYNKAQQTLKENYGVDNPMQVPEFFEKSQKTAFIRKKYIWKSGEVSMVQGYEPIVLSELEEQGYEFSDILTSPKDMPELIYEFEGKSHRYYPDFFIPNENLIIEVKSEYTLTKDLEKNKVKFQAVEAAGYNFRLEVR